MFVDHIVQRTSGISCLASQRQVLKIVIIRAICINGILSRIVSVIRKHCAVILIEIVSIITVICLSCFHIGLLRPHIDGSPIPRCCHIHRNVMDKIRAIGIVTAIAFGAAKVDYLNLGFIHQTHNACYHEFYFSVHFSKVRCISAASAIYIAGLSGIVFCIFCNITDCLSAGIGTEVYDLF